MWKEVSKDEVKAFIGLLVTMGILQLPRLEKYWKISAVGHGHQVFPRLCPECVTNKCFFFFTSVIALSKIFQVIQIIVGYSS